MSTFVFKIPQEFKIKEQRPNLWNLILLKNDHKVHDSFICSVIRAVLHCECEKSHFFMNAANLYGKSILKTTTKELAETLIAEIKIMHEQAVPILDYAGFGDCPVLFIIEPVEA